MNNSFEIRRILAALDASSRSLAGLESVAELASHFGAELMGLFVEDINLLRVAGLPFAREISLFSSTSRQIRLEILQQDLRSQAARIRGALAAAAEARGVPWSFRVVRGSVPAEILSAALEADLMILGKMTWAPAWARRLGSTARTVLMQGRGLTLILHQQISFKLPVSLIFDGSDLAMKALRLAAYLARGEDSELKVFIVASDRDKAREMRHQVREELEKRRLGAEFRLLINPSPSSLIRLIQTPLVLPINVCRGEDLCSLINEISAPVLLVR